jgi:hypothetical protein
MPGIADDKDHLEGDEKHEEEGVRAESDENQKTIRPNLNKKTARGDEQHEEEGVRAASDENLKTKRPNLNKKQQAVTNSMRKKVFVLSQTKIKRQFDLI